MTLWQNIYNNYVSLMRYQADMAKIKTYFKLFEKGIEIKFKGYSDTLKIFIIDFF